MAIYFTSPATIGAPCAIGSAPAASVPLQGAAGVNTLLVEKQDGPRDGDHESRSEFFQCGHDHNTGENRCRVIASDQRRLL